MSVLLAKSSGESLAAHTAWCLKAAKALLSYLPLSEAQRQRVQSDVLLAVALHDVGKAARGFQRVLLGEQEDWAGKRHEILSAAFASSLQGISSATLLAILTHHKSLPGDGITTAGFGCLPFEQLPWPGDLTPVWEEMKKEWLENLELFTPEWTKICEALERTDLANISPSLEPLTLDRVWLNRTTGRKGQRATVSFSERHHASLVRGLVIAADHLGSAHCVPPQIPQLKSYRVMRQNLRPFQEVAANTKSSGLLRAPTGSGKTEAALLWAQQNQPPNSRLFYVLPYTASINAMYKRLGPGISPTRPGIFGSGNVGLLHSRATAALYSMLEASGDHCSKLDRQATAKALTGLAREIWFPIRVCTPHQVLRYMLRGKGWEAMLAEFPNACFIFDEVHAYDPRVVGLTLTTARLVTNWGARCLFMSATFPSFLQDLTRKALGQIPLIVPSNHLERDKEILDKKRHVLEIRNGSLAENLESVIDAVETSPSTLIVCNHVRTAQTIFDSLRNRFGNNVYLLHSRFNQEDRNHIETKLLSRSLPKVLVATQVVEVSLDLDFHQAFLEPAPIDALVQRMGRVNRAGTREPSSVVVFTEQVNRYQLYCDCQSTSHERPCLVQRSINELRSLANPISEDDLIIAADQVYSDGYRNEDARAYEEGFTHPDIVDYEKRLLAGAHQDWVEQVIESTDGTIEALPSSLSFEYESRRRQGLWIEADALLVPVREKSLAYIRPKLDTSCDPWKVNCPYSQTKGLEL
ncbi:MAG: CRISPR-associated helicase Cas3 [Nitrospira sp.]|jgi:CRISPR-associated endonuclease/helicase Cas3|nr:MAG: CRISPR-associated helicase Cas3 [Nitrospira sp.]